MALMHAARLCPQAVLLPADFEQYRHYSRLFKAAVTALAPRMEDRGIDEVYIDFDAAPGGTEQGGRTLAGQIQQAVRASMGLSCSIGVAPNKLLAKMASELNKPNGITILHAGDLAEKIWPLPCRRINGVGPKASERLEQLGIHTLGELAPYESRLPVGQFWPHHRRWVVQTSLR